MEATHIGYARQKAIFNAKRKFYDIKAACPNGKANLKDQVLCVEIRWANALAEIEESIRRFAICKFKFNYL